MKALFWNIRGVKKVAGVRALQSILRGQSPNIVCLAEPMVKVSDFPSLLINKLGYAADLTHNDRLDKVPNLWILWKLSTPHPSIISVSEQQVSVTVNWFGSIVGLSFVHANCFKVKHRELWMELGVVVLSTIPWSVIGDFNAILLSNEKRGPGRSNVSSVADFQAMVDACLLVQVPSHGEKFTWTNNRKRGHVVAVLDRSFCNEMWLDLFKNIYQKVLLRTSSDHGPILVVSAVTPKPDEEVRKATEQLSSVQDDIEAPGMTDELFSKEADAKTALLKATQMQENLLSQKAKQRWMKDGDRNSKFFHLSVKMRRARNQIRSLKKEDGSWIDDQ
ncbi:uncharacterized protein LOC122094747 [Macadamia integrifolia]|uniref:uncharacterized protein LOC122094747 n=1 Tax=Macadamia integrifolia TaxID=60698 RepID=UPI001C529250|nr:uncharacterized protein LOC122094747 [Macadamia integrifolia]